jgi:hypothetical protein
MQTKTQDTNQQSFEENDEINLSEFFEGFWKKRLLVLAVAIIGFVVAGLYGIGKYSSLLSESVASVQIKLNFKGAELGQYPNGTRFTPTDVIASKVLTVVYNRNALLQQGISLDAFLSSINVYVWNPNRREIDAKYETLLSDKKLGGVERQQLNEQYQQELKNGVGRFLNLEWSSETVAKVSSSLAAKVLADIPKVWAQNSIQEYGVLDLKVVVPSQLDNYLLNNAEYVVVGDYLREFAKQLKSAAKQLQSDSVVGVLKDKESDKTVGDVFERITNLENFHLNVLQRSFVFAPTRLSNDSADLYLRSRLVELDERIAEADRKSEIINRVYREYTNNTQQRQGADSVPSDNTASYSPQFGDGFLSKLMSIGDELSDAKYKQGLLTERKEMAMKGAELTTERQRLEGILKALNSPKSKDSDVIAAAAGLTKQVAYVVDELKAQGAILNRIVELSRSTRLGKVGSLYELTREPQVQRQGLEAIKQTVKYSLFGMLGGLFLGLILAVAAMIVSSVK